MNNTCYSCDFDEDVVITTGFAIFVRPYDDFFDENGDGKRYKSRVYENPTFADAFVAFDESVDVTGDYHHVYFEGVEYLHTTAGISYYELVAGS